METRQVEVRTARAQNYLLNNETVKVEAKWEIGTFHCWEQNRDGEYSKAYAIVEMENGTVGRFDVEDIKFTGKPNGANLFEDGLDIEIE